MTTAPTSSGLKLSVVVTVYQRDYGLKVGYQSYGWDSSDDVEGYDGDDASEDGDTGGSYVVDDVQGLDDAGLLVLEGVPAGCFVVC